MPMGIAMKAVSEVQVDDLVQTSVAGRVTRGRVSAVRVVRGAVCIDLAGQGVISLPAGGRVAVLSHR